MVDDVVASTAASSAAPSREAIDALTGSTSSSNSPAVASGAVDSLTFDGSLLPPELVAQQMAAAQGVFARLEQQRVQIEQQHNLQQLLQRCRVLEEKNNRALSLQTAPYPVSSALPQQLQQQPHQQQHQQQQLPSQSQQHFVSPSVGAAAAGLINLGASAQVHRDNTTLVAAPAAPLVSAGFPPTVPQLTSASLRQMAGVQMGVEDNLRRYGLNRNDPAMSDHDDGSQGGDFQPPHQPRIIKSGKLVKITSRVVQAEKWPHSFLGRQYVGVNKEYEDLTLAEFCAGYSAILLEEQSSSILRFRLQHLEHLMYHATIYTWASVLKFHAAVLVEIEKGLKRWGDEFRDLQATILHVRQDNFKRDSASGGKTSGYSKPQSGLSVFYCPQFQGGTCTFSTDHDGPFRDRIRMLRHICAKCWQTNKQFQGHGSRSPSCPLYTPAALPATAAGFNLLTPNGNGISTG